MNCSTDLISMKCYIFTFEESVVLHVALTGCNSQLVEFPDGMVCEPRLFNLKNDRCQLRMPKVFEKKKCNIHSKKIEFSHKGMYRTCRHKSFFIWEGT